MLKYFIVFGICFLVLTILAVILDFELKKSKKVEATKEESKEKVVKEDLAENKPKAEDIKPNVLEIQQGKTPEEDLEDYKAYLRAKLNEPDQIPDRPKNKVMDMNFDDNINLDDFFIPDIDKDLDDDDIDRMTQEIMNDQLGEDKRIRKVKKLPNEIKAMMFADLFDNVI